jgi:hypothetical protein
VQALNGIELAFYGGGEKEKKVREAWKAHLDHLSTKWTKERQDEWVTRQFDLFIDLLHEMAVCLRYDFDKTHIRNSWYSPEAHGTIEQELNVIRRDIDWKTFIPGGRVRSNRRRSQGSI